MSPGKQPKMNIVIVGGSLGGLATGIALKALGHDTTILERNPDALLHNQGAGIVAGGDTLAFFKKYDRCNRPIAVSSQRRQYLNREGKVVHKVDMVQNMTSWDLTYYLMRANYDGVKSEYCDVPAPRDSDGTAVHLHGRTVTGLEEEGEQVRVFWTDAQGAEGSMLADLVVGADGPSSTIRKIFAPDVKRTYVGYCALRGTVPEAEGSEEAKEAFSERFAFYHGPGIQILAYLIPGAAGTLESGQRLFNFVYYTNFPDSDDATSPFKELMTDADGSFHRITMPPGKIAPEVWEKQKAIAREKLPPQFAEIVEKTRKPFAQAITDVKSPGNVYMGGKVVLIGDALAGFRPHTVASTSQACFNASSLANYLAGETTREQWVKETMQYARTLQNRGAEMGNRSQFGDLPLEEHVHDRNVASTKRADEVWPQWTWGEADDEVLMTLKSPKGMNAAAINGNGAAH